MTANFSTTRSAKAGDKVLPVANRLPVPAALRYSEIHKRYGEIFGLGEHPRDTVRRECWEELNFNGEFLVEEPIFVTLTDTVGKTKGHTDISIWYALKGDRRLPIKYDSGEFNGIKWFHKDSLPEKTDPHLDRFVKKLYAQFASYL